jgi:hypothetical protein
MVSLEQTDAITKHVVSEGLSEATLAVLRQSHPDIHFTYCMDDDINVGKPVVESDGFNIYLVDGREHCLCLTNDYDVATGVVLAEVIEDED